MIEPMNRLSFYMTAGATTFVQYAGVAGLLEEDGSIERMRQEFKRRRDYLVEEINKMQHFSCKKPEGAFYIFMNIKKSGMTADEFCAYAIDKYRLATIPGTASAATVKAMCVCPTPPPWRCCRRLSPSCIRSIRSCKYAAPASPPCGLPPTPPAPVGDKKSAPPDRFGRPGRFFARYMPLLTRRGGGWYSPPARSAAPPRGQSPWRGPSAPRPSP